jgi:hypothetical protein
MTCMICRRTVFLPSDSTNGGEDTLEVRTVAVPPRALASRLGLQGQRTPAVLAHTVGYVHPNCLEAAAK